MNQRKYHIVTIGGGSGQFALLSGLRNQSAFHISAVVSMMDSGGSTGRLRDELGILPPGDVLKCILALSPYQKIARKVLQKRFQTDRLLKGHNAGNMLLTMLSQYTGSFPAGVKALAEILDVKGEILPVTIDKATLVAELTDGTRIYGESAIDMPRGTQREKIRDVFLVPHHSDRITVYPPVIDAIRKAHFIIIGPGDLFTSILPNLIVPGLKKAIQKTKATIVYVLNIMTKYGETHNYRASDFLIKLEECIERSIDIAVYNTAMPNISLMNMYFKQKAEFVLLDKECEIWSDRKLYEAELLDTSGNIVRHDPERLASIIKQIVAAEEEES